MSQQRDFLVTGFLKNLPSHSSNKDDVTKQLCMLTTTFKKKHLQVQFWPLIHTFRKSSSCCYFLKWFQGTRSFSLLFVVFCCLAEVLAWLLKSHWSELQWNRSCLWAEGSWLPWSHAPLVRDECPQIFGSAPYFGLLLLHYLLITDTLFTSKVKLIPARGWGLYWGKPVGLGTTTNLTAFLVEDCLLWPCPFLRTPHIAAHVFFHKGGRGMERSGIW